MKENEKAFLAQVAMGWFNVNAEEGTIWRMARSIGGSRIGTKPYMKLTGKMERAERCASRNHLKIFFTVASRRRMSVYAHRIIWMMANHSEILEGLEINHKDGNPRNNHPSNLEIVTRSQNCLHAGRILHVLGKKPQRGELNSTHKLTMQKVIEIRRLCKERQMTQGRIATLFGVRQSTVNNIYHRKTWSHLPESRT